MINDALKIIDVALKNSDPYKNVSDALSEKEYPPNLTVIATGKAACTMAKAAYDILGNKISKGFILTKYLHSFPMPDVFDVFEAGHPLPDDNSIKYTKTIVDYAKNLTENDRILFLLSGGASALFELSAVSLEELISTTDKLLKCGADITEINIIRKKLSLVKGGKFANMCRCNIECLILSDVLGDRIEMIASGPCCSDNSTADDVSKIINKYNLDLKADFNFDKTTVTNVKNKIIGSISMLCDGAKLCAEKLGYNAEIITTTLTGEAQNVGKEIAEKAIEFSQKPHNKTVFIYGGETTVTVKGNGKGGRNQEIALSASIVLKNQPNIVLFSLGSDGTDGPTDAAGGIATGESYNKMIAAGINPENFLKNNDSYNALDSIGDLIKTGPTGTNVNDITVVIIK